ncbi:MutS-related protein [Enterococcus sp. LJL120]
MNEQLFIICIILAVIVLLIAFSIWNSIKLRRQVRYGWGKLPNSTAFDKEKSLKEAYLEARKYHTTDSEVDDITWYDLDLIDIFDQINHTYSSIGSEALYQRLRSFNFSEADQAELEELITFYQENPQQREDVEYAFAKLGKRDKNFVVRYLSQSATNRLGSLWFFILLGLLPFFGILLLFLNLGIGLFIALGAIIFNIVYYQTKKQELDMELSSMSYLVQSISTAKKISKVATPKQAEIKQSLKPLQSILKFAVSFRIKSNSESEMFFEYINIMLMLPFISYHFVVDRIAKHNQEAIDLWQVLGKLEVAAAVLNYRSLLPVSCPPTFQKGGVEGETVYHPLVENAVANPVDWQKNTLVTGSNASGKSTYVRAIALNCILGQTIYTCLAEEFILERGHVLTSMAVEDDIFEGDSYFVAEIKSIKRVLEKVKTKERCYCFIDEILKGTNTIERISASASIVKWLSDYPSLVYVATHDIELTEILKNYCTDVHFEEQVTEGQGVSFDYVLRQGPARTRNAIRLLKVLDYPDAIVKKAQDEAESFDTTRQWPIFE